MTEDIHDRLDRLESLVERQQETIESQQETIEEQRDRITDLEAQVTGASETGAGETTTDRTGPAEDERRPKGVSRTQAESGDAQQQGRPKGVSVSRRTALTAGGLLALLGVGASTASAAPRGQIGRSSTPVDDLYVQDVFLDDDGGGAIRSKTSLRVNVDDDGGGTGEAFTVSEGTGPTDLLTVEQNGMVTVEESLAFGDADGDGNVFSVSEDSTSGHLDVSHSGTVTVEAQQDGDFRVSGSFDETGSL